MEDVKRIVTDIKNKNFKPIYFLMGEEAYYIDKISDFIEANVLSEEEKGFNQMVMYGRDVSIEDIVGQAKRFPMMAERQVVIVKEAQELSRTIDNIVAYAKNPQPTTVLVICYKYKKLDKRKASYKAIKKCGEVFESKKLYDNQIPNWISRVLAGKNYTITHKASQMLAEFLGTDLGKINNELEKLQIILPKGSEITPEAIEENIGISKDYNNFELLSAIGFKDKAKAFKIIKYFGDNPKDNPIIVTNALLFGYFTKLLKLHGLSDRNPRNVASTLGIGAYFVDDHLKAARNYPMRRVSQIISLIREFDLKSKGVNANATPQRDLLKELLVKIMD